MFVSCLALPKTLNPKLKKQILICYLSNSSSDHPAGEQRQLVCAPCLPKMPGVYSKPPKRTDFFKDLQSIVTEGKKSQNSKCAFRNFVHVAADAIQKERIIAREEAERDLKNESICEQEKADIKSKQASREVLARKEVEVAEAFFGSGAHAFFCSALETSAQEAPEIVDRILGVSLCH